MQNQTEEDSKEVKADDIDLESNILFTMNVDTQDINIVLDKEIVEENKSKSANVEKPESPLKVVDTQQNVEIQTEKEQEQKKSEPTENKNENKDENVGKCTLQ